MRSAANIELEHPPSSLDFGQWNVDAFFESKHLDSYDCAVLDTGDSPSLDSWVQLPWYICSPEYQYTRIVVPHTVYLPFSRAQVLLSPAPRIPS